MMSEDSIAGFKEFQPKDQKHLDYCIHCEIPFNEHLGMTATCAKLQMIFALVEAHRTEQHYRKSHADLRLWEVVLGLKDSTGI